MDHDERVVVRAERHRVHDRAVGDVQRGRRDLECLGALHGEGMHARELVRSDLDGVAEELIFPDRLEHADSRGDGELDGLDLVKREASVLVGRVCVRMPAAVAPTGAFTLAAIDEGLEIEVPDLCHEREGNGPRGVAQRRPGEITLKASSGSSAGRSDAEECSEPI